MSKKKAKNKQFRITVKEYVKAVKKADREIQLANQPGWQRTTNVHKSKKTYNRRDNRKDFLEEE